MFNKNDFISSYTNYTDEQLLNILAEIDEYGDEAKAAFYMVIEQKGGMERLQNVYEDKKVIDDEIARIAKETSELGIHGVDASLIKTITTSNIFSNKKVQEVIDNQYADVVAEIEDKQVTSKTIAASVISGGIASVVGGILWGLQLIYTNRIFYIFGFGLVLLCYGIIKLTTKKSKNNTAVFLATFISVIVAIVLDNYCLKCLDTSNFKKLESTIH